jgi:hypothetical protein
MTDAGPISSNSNSEIPDPNPDDPASYRGRAQGDGSDEHSRGQKTHLGADKKPTPLPENPAGAIGKLDAQKQHLVCNALTPNASQLLFELAKRGHYNHRDFEKNGVYLPDDASIADAIGALMHDGSHPPYNEFVSRMLDEIGREHQESLIKEGPPGENTWRETGEKVKKLQAEIAAAKLRIWKHWRVKEVLA